MLQEAQQRHKLYLNIRRAKNGSSWEALVFSPHCCDLPVGGHALQVVAACIADDAAMALQRAGVERPPRLNFDAVTRQMVSWSLLFVLGLHRHRGGLQGNSPLLLTRKCPPGLQLQDKLSGWCCCVTCVQVLAHVGVSEVPAPNLSNWRPPPPPPPRKRGAAQEAEKVTAGVGGLVSCSCCCSQQLRWLLAIRSACALQVEQQPDGLIFLLTA